MTPQIIVQKGRYWIARIKDGSYEVFREEGTHSVRCAVIGYKGDEGLSRAKAELERRLSLEPKRN